MRIAKQILTGFVAALVIGVNDDRNQRRHANERNIKACQDAGGVVFYTDRNTFKVCVIPMRLPG